MHSSCCVPCTSLNNTWQIRRALSSVQCSSASLKPATTALDQSSCSSSPNCTQVRDASLYTIRNGGLDLIFKVLLQNIFYPSLHPPATPYLRAFTPKIEDKELPKRKSETNPTQPITASLASYPLPLYLPDNLAAAHQPQSPKQETNQPKR